MGRGNVQMCYLEKEIQRPFHQDVRNLGGNFYQKIKAYQKLLLRCMLVSHPCFSRVKAIGSLELSGKRAEQGILGNVYFQRYMVNSFFKTSNSTQLPLLSRCLPYAPSHRLYVLSLCLQSHPICTTMTLNLLYYINSFAFIVSPQT